MNPLNIEAIVTLFAVAITYYIIISLIYLVWLLLKNITRKINLVYSHTRGQYTKHEVKKSADGKVQD